MRDPQLRASAAQWWDNQRINGAWVREDLGIQKLADKLGYGYTNINVNPHPNTPMGIVIGGPSASANVGVFGNDTSKQPTSIPEEAKLRTNAKRAVQALKEGMLAPVSSLPH